MTSAKTPVAPVEYPLLADRTIAVGDRVRSFDFPGNPACYFVGKVTGTTKQEQYNIEVEVPSVGKHAGAYKLLQERTPTH